MHLILFFIHPSRQPEATTASNSAGQPTNKPLTPTTPPSVLRQQVKRLKEQLEEARAALEKSPEDEVQSLSYLICDLNRDLCNP